MIKCQKCGKIINTNLGEKCPNCGETKRLLDEEVHDIIGLSDTVSVIRFFERISLKKLLINIALIFLVSLLGFFFTGIWGVLIGFFIGIIIFLKAPPYRETGAD
jgi:DNA-directed RNA polymerase subunit RPC12/RpoP